MSITALSAAASIYGQQQQMHAQSDYQNAMADANAKQIAENGKLANESYIEQTKQLQIKSMQESAQAEQQIIQNDTAALKAQATAKASASDAGVSGLSVDALMADYKRQKDAYDSTIRTNVDWSKQQLKDDGSKEYVKFSPLDPFATFLGVAADVHDMMTRLDHGTRESLAVSLSVALANNVSNKTYLKGLTQTLSLISNGAMNREASMKNAMYQRVASYIPAYASLYNDDVELKEVRSVVDAVAQKVPGWSSSVEAKRDMFGEKQLYPEGWIGKALNPLTASDQTSDPVRQEIARLAGSSAGKAFLPVPHKDGNINLLDWQNAKGQTAYDRLMELHGSVKIGGKPLHDRMGGLIQSDLYQQKLHDGTELYPNSKRVELVNNLRSTYRQVAMQQLLKEFPDIAAAVRVDQVNRASRLSTSSRETSSPAKARNSFRAVLKLLRVDRDMVLPPSSLYWSNTSLRGVLIPSAVLYQREAFLTPARASMRSASRSMTSWYNSLSCGSSTFLRSEATWRACSMDPLISASACTSSSLILPRWRSRSFRACLRSRVSSPSLISRP